MSERRLSPAMAMAIVAMMAVCPLLAAVDNDAEADETYTIEMRTGDMFTYRPVTNLESRIEATPLSGMTFEDGVMTASFDTVNLTGNLATVISATWTSDVSDVKQVATQYIVFKVHPHVAIDGISAPVAAAMSGAAAGTVLYKPVVSEASEGTVTEVTCSVIENDYVGWDSENKQVYLKKAVPADVSASEMVLSISAINRPVDDSSTLQPDEATVQLTVAIGGGLAIVSDDSIEMKQSETDSEKLTYTIETNADQDASGKLHIEGYSFDVSSLPAGLVKSTSGAKVVFDPSVVEFPEGAEGDDAVKEFSFGVTVKGLKDGVTLEVSKTVTLRVYADMEYITLPSFSDVTVHADSKNPKSVLLSAKIGGADKVAIDWGDSSYDSKAVPESGTINLDHGYGKAGKYVIALEAKNDAGSRCCYVKYDAATGAFDVSDDKPSTDDSAKDKGAMSGVKDWLPYILMAIGAVLGAAFFLVRPSWAVLIAAAIFAGLGIALYVLS